GCDLAQGFVVCPPLTSRQFNQWLDRRQPEEFNYLDPATGAPLPAVTSGAPGEGASSGNGAGNGNGDDDPESTLTLRRVVDAGREGDPAAVPADEASAKGAS